MGEHHVSAGETGSLLAILQAKKKPTHIWRRCKETGPYAPAGDVATAECVCACAVVCTHRRAALYVLNELALAGRAVEQTAAVELSLQVFLSLVVQHLPRGVQQGLLQGEPDLSTDAQPAKSPTSKRSELTCCPLFMAKQEQETPNWKRKTMKRMTMYWGSKGQGDRQATND